ncbi:MAG: ABC transporter ATP-binding protein [Lentimicrobiaceae bacterium]|nr:ABC transporter ATP-binding protein [Lentimicrobiaceae bacterium]
MIKADNIYKSYGALSVLKGISLEVNKGEIVSVVGASGAGKSTLLHIIGTLDRADKGNLLINNIDINKLNNKSLASFRNKHIGFVFQFHHLLPEFTAIENVCIPAFIAKSAVKKTEGKAKQLLDLLNLNDRIHHKPSELSGGEQQRVAVARALINNPDVVLADEPSGNLDSANARELHQLFFNLREKFQLTFVIVTHNQELANMADRKLTIKDGIFSE